MGDSSSGGIYNQAFNVSVHWSGSIQDATNPNLTLSDNTETVTGTLIKTDHRCFTTADVTATSVQVSANSSGGDSLTGSQEHSNEGTVSLRVITIELADTTGTTFTVAFTLSGTSTSLSRLCSGT